MRRRTFVASALLTSTLLVMSSANAADRMLSAAEIDKLVRGMSAPIPGGQGAADYFSDGKYAYNNPNRGVNSTGFWHVKQASSGGQLCVGPQPNSTSRCDRIVEKGGKYFRRPEKGLDEAFELRELKR